jgi:hypothetical protein
MLSSVSMPYRPHSEYRPPNAPPVTVSKPRPSAAWFAVGGAMMVVATIVFVIAVVGLVRSIAHTDAEFASTGTHQVTLPASTQRAVFVVRGQPTAACTAVDGSGASVDFRRPSEEFTYNDWVAVRVFDTGDGQLTFTCGPGRVGEIRIARDLGGGDIARLGFFGILFPFALGGAGFVVVVITTILWFTRRPVLPPGPPAGWSPGTPTGPPPPTY